MHRALLFIVLLMGLPLRAQTSPTTAEAAAPLLEALAFVPDDENSRFYVYYGNFDVAIRARGLEAVRDGDGPLSDEELRSLARALPTAFQFMTTLSFVGETQAVMGLDFFEIEHAIEFGRMPNSGLALLGAFDGEAIAAAHQARGYEAIAEGEVSAWCFAGDCTNGLNIDFNRIDPANLFGGLLGRSQPVAIVGDEAVFSAPTEAVFGDMLAVVRGRRPSLADMPDYRALAHALGTLGTVRQLIAGDPALLYAPDFLGVRTPDPQPQGALPQYVGYAVADVVIPEGELAVVALVYDSAETAAEAAAVLEQRLDTFPSLQGQQTLRAGFLAEGARRVSTTAYADDETSLHVILVVIEAPPPADDTQDERRAISGRFFWTLYQGLIGLRLEWLRE